MSTFITDKMQIVKTKDEYYLFFMKGGDNNSYDNNKRSTSWFLQKIFKTKDDFDKTIERYIKSDISGGSWQFNTFRNIEFKTTIEYHARVFLRFESTFKKTFESSIVLDSINVKNIRDISNILTEEFKSNGIKLSSESLGIINHSYDKFKSDEEVSVANIFARKYVYKESNKYSKYKEFCIKYKDFTSEELIKNLSFCSVYKQHQTAFGNPLSILFSIKKTKALKEFDFANLNLLINNKETIKSLMLGHNVQELLELYPVAFQTLNCLDNFKECINELVESTNSKEDRYSYDMYKKNSDLIFNSDYKLLRHNLDEMVANQFSNAKEALIEAWNNLVPDSYFKTTNTKLERTLKEVKDNLELGGFEISDCLFSKEKFENNEPYLKTSNFDKLIEHHKNQYSKNKKIIKEVASYIINNFAHLIKEDTKLALCSYFEIDLIKKDSIKEVTTEEVITKEDSKTKLTKCKIIESNHYDKESLKAFSTGSLF